MKNLIELTRADFDSVVSKNPVVLLDFWASWCGPCKTMIPIVETLAERHPEIIIGRVNADEHQELAMAFNVMGLPSFVLLKNGQVAGQCNGSRTLEKLEEFVTL